MKRIAVILLALLAASVAARAAPNFTAEPKDKWLPEEAMKAKVAALGDERTKTFKVSGKCYEIYGFTRDGKKTEVYFNLVTGEVVKSEIGG